MHNQTLKDFYLGNLRPCEQSMRRNSEAARLMAALTKSEDALTQALPSDLQPVLNHLVDTQAELNRLIAEESYIDGFKTGARFLMEVPPPISVP